MVDDTFAISRTGVIAQIDKSDSFVLMNLADQQHESPLVLTGIARQIWELLAGVQHATVRALIHGLVERGWNDTPELEHTVDSVLDALTSLSLIERC